MTQVVDGRGLSEVDTFSKVDERGLSEVGELSGDDGLPGPPPASTGALSEFSRLRSPITQQSSPRRARDPSDQGTIEHRAMGTRCPAPTTQGPRPKDQAPAARGMRTQRPAPTTLGPGPGGDRGQPSVSRGPRQVTVRGPSFQLRWAAAGPVT